MAYAVLIAAFAVTGFARQPAQPFAGFALAATTAALAVSLPRTAVPAVAPRRSPDPAPVA